MLTHHGRALGMLFDTGKGHIHNTSCTKGNVGNMAQHGFRDEARRYGKEEEEVFHH